MTKPKPDKHHCAAPGCSRLVATRLLMCLDHWRQVPRRMQRVIWKEYRQGQEDDLALVTPAYQSAVRAALDYLAAAAK